MCIAFSLEAVALAVCLATARDPLLSGIVFFGCGEIASLLRDAEGTWTIVFYVAIAVDG